MKTTQLILAIALMVIISTGCDKEAPNPTGTSTFSYTELRASQDTIAIGATTTVTAIATGDGLTYSWSTSNGYIIGSGSQVIYGASGCCGGNNSVTCVVKDAHNNQGSKTIIIVVQ